MMETEQTTGSCPAPGQAAVRTWLSSSTRGAVRTSSDTTSRFDGEGVRYKAKLIGVDPVPDAQGDKMCWDSMMKLKGFAVAARSQGKHKQRIWLKISSSGLKIMDERSGAVLHDHDRSRITSLKKDDSDPRALAYVYQHQDSYSLFYIKMANLADPVLADIKEVCQEEEQETPQEPAEASTQNSSLLLLTDCPAPTAEGPALEDVFSPRSSPGQSKQVSSSSNDLLEVFSVQLIPQSSGASQPESPQPTLSNSQILSIFPKQPVGGSPYASPPYSPTAMSWGPQGLLGNQWAGPAVTPWPTMSGWPPACGQIETQPGVMSRGSTPTTANGYPTPLNSLYTPTGTTGPLQAASPTLDQNPFL